MEAASSVILQPTGVIYVSLNVLFSPLLLSSPPQTAIEETIPTTEVPQVATLPVLISKKDLDSLVLVCANIRMVLTCILKIFK